LAPNAKLRAQVVPQEPERPAQAAPPAECEATCAHHRPVRLGWAKLLKQGLEIDMAHCPNCGAESKIIAAILEQPVIEKILTYLSLQADGGVMTAPARGHALQEGLAFASANAASRAGRRHARQRVAAASGLRLFSQHVSARPVRRAAGIGCARASQSQGLAPDCPRKPEDGPSHEARLGCDQSSTARSRTQGPHRGESRALRGPLGEKVRSNFLSSDLPRFVGPAT